MVTARVVMVGVDFVLMVMVLMLLVWWKCCWCCWLLLVLRWLNPKPLFTASYLNLNTHLANGQLQTQWFFLLAKLGLFLC